jgi:hypothetical protein
LFRVADGFRKDEDMNIKMALVVVIGVALGFLLSGPLMADCPTNILCKCVVGTPTTSVTPNPPACFGHADGVVVGDGTSKDGCCKLAVPAECSIAQGCYFKIVITAVAAPGSTCDFQINQGGDQVAVCPGTPTPPSCTSTAAEINGHYLQCGMTEQYTVRIAGVRVATISMSCGNC